MNDEVLVRDLFGAFLSAIAEQNSAALTEMADRSFAVHHIMTGKSQSGSEFISDIAAGRFRIFTAGDISADLRVIGDSAFVIGKLTADCEIYGTDRCKRRLAVKPILRKSADGWKFTDVRISELSE